jgi:energy-coupling factor transport system substrate-specific component
MSEKKRYWIVMLIAIGLNIGMKQVTYYGNLPFFLECTGTVLAAAVLEPAAGLLAGLVENFMLAALWNGPASILYFTISASYALIYGLVLKKGGRMRWKYLPLTMFLTILAVTVSDAGITYLMDGPVLERWEGIYQMTGLAAGMGVFGSYLFGIAAIQTFDVIATTALFALIYFLLPKQLTNRRKP